MSILFESFGYKNGIPGDADFVFDARSLPNPYWDSTCARSPAVTARHRSSSRATPGVPRLLEDITRFIEARIPEFTATNRRYLTIAIGCTGGQHRSVYLVETHRGGLRRPSTGGHSSVTAISRASGTNRRTPPLSA